MKIIENFDLTNLNTLSIPSHSKFYCKLTNLDQLPGLVDYAKRENIEIRVLGCGSNLVLNSTVNALVIHNKLSGREIVNDNTKQTVISVMAGEDWHSLVKWSVDRELSGLENLALIPGTVGAAPVQNIGAYGCEFSNVLESVKGFDLSENKYFSFNKNECEFGYRNSIFKKHEGRFIITSVLIRLKRTFEPNVSYGLLNSLSDHVNLKPIDVFNEVTKLRQSKLPDPKSVPNAGSFFKNPIVSLAQHEILSREFPTLVSFAFHEDFKLAAGWMIDQCGLKGESNSAGVGCFELQALVVINPESADYFAVKEWSDFIIKTVFTKFNVTLEQEPIIWS